jgi:hypothetical protein
MGEGEKYISELVILCSSVRYSSLAPGVRILSPLCGRLFAIIDELSDCKSGKFYSI